MTLVYARFFYLPAADFIADARKPEVSHRLFPGMRERFARD